MQRTVTLEETKLGELKQHLSVSVGTENCIHIAVKSASESASQYLGAVLKAIPTDSHVTIDLASIPNVSIQAVVSACAFKGQGKLHIRPELVAQMSNMNLLKSPQQANGSSQPDASVVGVTRAGVQVTTARAAPVVDSPTLSNALIEQAVHAMLSQRRFLRAGQEDSQSSGGGSGANVSRAQQDAWTAASDLGQGTIGKSPSDSTRTDSGFTAEEIASSGVFEVKVSDPNLLKESSRLLQNQLQQLPYDKLCRIDLSVFKNTVVGIQERKLVTDIIQTAQQRKSAQKAKQVEALPIVLIIPSDLIPKAFTQAAFEKLGINLVEI
jgi:hypothetical protein